MQCTLTHPVSQLAFLEAIDDPTLAELLSNFIAAQAWRSSNGGWDEPGPHPFHAAQAYGNCYLFAQTLMLHLTRNGMNAWMPEISPGGDEPTAELFELTDRVNYGCIHHYWTCVKSGERIWGIDLSAMQYGYTGPVVRVCPADSPAPWARTWAAYRGGIGRGDVQRNRIAAGVPAELLDPRHDIWLGPDGTWRHLQGTA